MDEADVGAGGFGDEGGDSPARLPDVEIARGHLDDAAQKSVLRSQVLAEDLLRLGHQ
jgi:hypothetical protein